MRVIVSSGGCYNGISSVLGGFWRCGGRFFGWRGRSVRGLIGGGDDFRKVKRDMQKDIL